MIKFLQQVATFLTSKINLIALNFCAISVGFWMILLAKRYYYFIGTGGWDTALLSQIVRTVAHGSFYSTLNGSNFIADHCYFISFLLVPFYWLWPDPMFLRYFQVWAFFAGAYLFFLILKKRLNPWIALGAMIAFTLAPANIAMLRACFNYEIFAIPIVFLIFKAFEEKKYGQFLLYSFLLCMVKEQMPLVVMMFGLLALMLRDEGRFKWAVVPFLMGLAIFVLEVFVLVPYVRRDLPVTDSSQWKMYSNFGKTPSEIVIYMLTHPEKIIQQFVTEDIIKWYNDLFGMWGGLAFFSPQILFPAIPLFLKSILRQFKLEHNVLGVYYASVFTPYIFLAVWTTLNHIQNQWRIWIHAIAIAFMLLHAVNYFPKLLFPMFKMSISTKAMTVQRFLDRMPDDTSLVGLLDYSHNWKELYWYHGYLDGRYQSGRKFELPEHIEYLLADLSDVKREKQINRLINNPEFYKRWRLVESIEELALYQRNTSQAPQIKLVEVSKQSFLDQSVKLKVFEGVIAFEEMTYPEEFPKTNRIFPVTTYWKGVKKTAEMYKVSFKVFLNNKEIFHKNSPIGSTIYQTSRWASGEHIKENYFYLLPRLEPGTYQLELRVFNSKTQKSYGCIARETGKEKLLKRSFIVK